MSDAALLERRIFDLTTAIVAMARTTGTRLTRAQMCERLGVCGKTLTDRVRKGEAPKPGRDGKWLLAEVVEWEQRK